MNSTASVVLFGEKSLRRRAGIVIGAVCGVFVLSFAVYVLGIAGVSGGLVVIPFHAAVIGTIGAVWSGLRRTGLVVAWSVSYASMLGFNAYTALRVSPRPLVDRLAVFLEPDGLAVLGAESLILGTVAYLVSVLTRRSLTVVRSTDTSPASK